MSGTSVDAVDAALVSFEQSIPRLHALHSQPIPANLKKTLLQSNQDPQLALATLCELQVTMAQLFATAVTQLLAQQGLSADQVCAIGSHGQTLFHHPQAGMSLQIGHPAIIAKHTKIPTAGDFRIDDMAIGGQGAPFAPVFHQVLFSQTHTPTLAVNIGGIANISYLPAGDQANTGLLGWDTGPGNALLDETCQRYFDQAYDAQGALSASGSCQSKLLDALLTDNYFSQPTPKSTGRDYFNWQWLTQRAQLAGIPLESIPAQDLLCTLTELTALSIVNAIKALPDFHEVTNLWLCGGGALNTFLQTRLQYHLPSVEVKTSLDKGISPHAIEGMLFAWLAKQRLEHRPVALHRVTGAKRDAILGGLWLP